MKDLKAHLAQVRSDAAECLLLATLTNDEKSQMFVKLAEHLNGLAVEIEKALAEKGASATPAVLHPEPAVDNLAAAVHQDPNATDLAPAVHRGTAASNTIIAPVQKTKRARKAIAWLLITAAAVGTFVWAKWHVDWARQQIEEILSSSIEHAKNSAPSPMEDKTASFPNSGEQSERLAVVEQLAALGIRVAHLEGELEKLKNFQNKGQASSEEAKPASGPQASVSEEMPRSPAGDHTFTVPNPIKPPDSSPVGLADQTGTTVVPTTGELGDSKPRPPGCERFRSYDATSKTYVTFDGRRRPCGS